MRWTTLLICVCMLAAFSGCQSDDAAPVSVFEFESPLAPVTVSEGGPLEITLMLEGGVAVEADLYADGDGDLATTSDQVPLASGIVPSADLQRINWDTAGVPPGRYHVVARVADGAATFDVIADGAVTVNANPVVQILVPGVGTRFPAGRKVEIRYTDNDPDDVARTTIYADQDGDLDSTDDQTVIEADRPDGNGATQSVSWDTSGALLEDYYIICRTVSLSNDPSMASTRIALIADVGVGVALGANSFDTARQVISYDDGSCVLSGILANSVTFGEGEANETTLTSVAGTFDVFLARYNADGTLAWARLIPGTGNNDDASCMERFSDGSFVVSGAVDGTSTFGAGEATETAIAEVGEYSLFVAKYNADGSLAWVRAAEDAGVQSGRGIATFADGSCVVTGHHTNAATFGPGESNETTLDDPDGSAVFVARFNDDGSLAWAKSVDGGLGDDVGEAATALSDGSCVVAGRFAGSASFGTTSLVSAGATDAFWARYRADGTVVWARRAGSAGDDVCRGVSAITGSILLSGYFEQVATFGPGESEETELQSDGGSDLFVARCNVSVGTLEWVRQAGGAGNIVAARQDSIDADSIAVTGHYTGDFNLGSGEAGETTLPSQGDRGVWTARFESDGTLVWASYAEGGGRHQAGLGVATNNDGSCWIAGRFSGASITFGESVSLENPTSNGPDDTAIFLVRLNVDGQP